jgi:hypothetical protein
MCIFTAHPGEYINCSSGWISYRPSICAFIAHPDENLSAHENFLLHIYVNFYRPSMCIITTHPGEYLNCAFGWITYRPSICAFTAHPGEHLIAHIGEFLTVHPCVLLPHILVNVLLCIWLNFLPAFHVYFTAHPGEYLNGASRWISYCPSMCSFTAYPG